MHLGAGQRRLGEAHANFDAFDGVDAHHGLGNLAVQLGVPLDMAAQPYGQSHGDDLEHAA